MVTLIIEADIALSIMLIGLYMITLVLMRSFTRADANTAARKGLYGISKFGNVVVIAGAIIAAIYNLGLKVFHRFVVL